MLSKRLVGVITVKDGWAVQSFGYRRYLPLGRPECLAENLDRWGVDEILLMSIDRSRRGVGPDVELLRRIGALGLSTPLAYSGGVHTVAHAATVIEAGAERFCVDAALHGDHRAVREMARQVGAQAVIAALPLECDGGLPRWHDYRSGVSAPFTADSIPLFSEGVVSEALVVDFRHEGQRNAFDMNIVHRFPVIDVPLIAFGGVSEAAQFQALLKCPQVVAVGVGNFLNYSEHAVQRLKRKVVDLPLRPAAYASD